MKKFYIASLGIITKENIFLKYGKPCKGHKSHKKIKVGQMTLYTWGLSGGRSRNIIKRVE